MSEGSVTPTCSSSGCRAAPARGRTRCEKHHAYHLESQKRYRARKRAAGQCGQCGEPAHPGRARCFKCLRAENARVKAKRAERVAAGLCTYPGNNCPDPAAPGRAMCEKHLAVYRSYLKAYRNRQGTKKGAG